RLAVHFHPRTPLCRSAARSERKGVGVRADCCPSFPDLSMILGECLARRRVLRIFVERALQPAQALLGLSVAQQDLPCFTTQSRIMRVFDDPLRNFEQALPVRPQGLYKISVF